MPLPKLNIGQKPPSKVTSRQIFRNKYSHGIFFVSFGPKKKQKQERFSVVTGNYYRNSDGHSLRFLGQKKGVDAPKKNLGGANRDFSKGSQPRGGGFAATRNAVLTYITLIWSNYSDVTRPHPKMQLRKGNPLISGKSRLVKYYSLARLMFFLVGWHRSEDYVTMSPKRKKTCMRKRVLAFWMPKSYGFFVWGNLFGPPQNLCRERLGRMKKV